jgi:isoleucyl-tRNA synthetase
MQLLQNHKVSFVPGWDCHGLPIELKGKFICTKVYISSSSYANLLDLVD